MSKHSLHRFRLSVLGSSSIDNSFVHQLSSWSPLQTSLETMQKLLTEYKVCPDFLEAIYAFGAKVTMDDDTYFNLCYHRTYSSLAETLGPHHGINT